MTAPRPPLDPDPRHVEADDLWDPQAGAWVPRQSAVVVLVGGLVMGAVLGFLFAIAIVHAAPRPAATVIPTDATRGTAERLASSGNLSQPTGAPPRDGMPVEAAAEASGVAAALDAGVGGAPPSPELDAQIESGIASWFDDGPGLYAAVHSWHWGDRRYQVRVCAESSCVVVTVRDFCGCPGGRVIDLSPAAFAELAPLSRGVIEVTIEDLRGPGATPPPTDVQP